MTAARAHREPARATGWTNPAFARVAEVVHLVAGLVFPPNRQPSAESGMRRAMTALRVSDPLELARAVGVPGEARDAVLAELTIGESYFFRESGQLDLLRTTVLPSLAPLAGPARPLRLWSAGCASGEEPYTLAILIRELGWTAPARILGTDVATPRLDAARRGRYTRWALRGVSDERVARWFERRGPHFQLHPDIRASVEFAALNLVAGDYPDAASGTSEQDVVLCRNVLIYFDMPTIERIATRLLASLAPEGWLVCGASDPPLAGLVPCEVVMTPHGMAYRRADRPGAAARAIARPDSLPARPWAGTRPAGVPRPPIALVRAPAVSRPGPADPMPAVADADDAHAPVREAYAAADYARAESLARAALDADASSPALWVVFVRAIANQGRLREADLECTRALDQHRLVAELHHLHATLLAAAGLLPEAVKAARRALYLDRALTVAHLHLGDLLARTADRDGAARAFETAAAQLSVTEDDIPVPAADGVPASRLRAVAELRLRGLRDEAGA